jgi:hypothetical protein
LFLPLADLHTRTSELLLSFTQHPFAIPYDPASKCVDGTIRTNFSFVAVALHQFERAVATSHLEAKMVRAHPNSPFSFHAGHPFSRSFDPRWLQNKTLASWGTVEKPKLLWKNYLFSLPVYDASR